MRIRVSCASCDHEFSVSDEFSGRRVKCPSCGEAVRVYDVSDDDEPESRPRRKGNSDKRSKHAGQGSNQGLILGMGIGGGVVVLGLIGIIVFLLMSPRQAANPVAVNPPPVQPAAAPSPAPVVATPAPTTPSSGFGTGGTAAPAVASNSPRVTEQIAAKPAQNSAPVPEQPDAPSDSSGDTVATADEPAASGNPTGKTQPPGKLPELKGVPAPSSEKLDLPQLIQRVEPSVVRINVISPKGASTGSGFVVSNDGTVVTNYHVVTDALDASVEFKNGDKAKVLGYRHLVKKADIAIIKIEMPSNKLKPVPISAELPLEGEYVATFGAPHGLSFSKSEGVISAIREEKDLGEEMGLDMIGTWLQFTAPISPGNSGGPLVDKYGKVVGMNTMQLSVGQNLNFAVSALEINKALNEAPAKVRPLKPEDLKPYERQLSRRRDSEEYDTARGRRLLAEVKEIVLVNAAKRRNFDPSGAMWGRVILRSQKAIEKTGIQLSEGEQRPDLAFMVVLLEMKPSKKGTDGTQDLMVTAELTCVDPLAKKNEPPLAKVWKAEKKIGTISLGAAASGKVPQTVDTNLAEFFGSFRTAYNRAVKATKEAKP